MRWAALVAAGGTIGALALALVVGVVSDGDTARETTRSEHATQWIRAMARAGVARPPGRLLSVAGVSHGSTEPVRGVLTEKRLTRIDSPTKTCLADASGTGLCATPRDIEEGVAVYTTVCGPGSPEGTVRVFGLAPTGTRVVRAVFEDRSQRTVPFDGRVFSADLPLVRSAAPRAIRFATAIGTISRSVPFSERFFKIRC